MTAENIIFIFEMVGTVVFAVTGVITAIEKKLDIFGAVVLGMATAVGGGIIRDLILGYLPPTAFRKPVFAITAIVTSILALALAWCLGKRIKKHFDIYAQIINAFDSIGLAVFTIGGINVAAACGFGENSFLSIFVGILTGVGGGMLRDIMAGKIPGILRERVYALAALLGALVYQVLVDYDIMDGVPAMLCGAIIILLVRALATIFKWNLPKIDELADE